MGFNYMLSKKYYIFAGADDRSNLVHPVKRDMLLTIKEAIGIIVRTFDETDYPKWHRHVFYYIVSSKH
jgi:hypothetical protein